MLIPSLITVLFESVKGKCGQRKISTTKSSKYVQDKANQFVKVDVLKWNSISSMLHTLYHDQDTDNAYVSCCIRNPTTFIGKNKEANQLYLCFRYTDSTIPVLHKSEISSFLPFSVTAKMGLCRTWSESKINLFSCIGSITKTCPCNVYALEPHYYIAKLGYTGVNLFFLFLLQNTDCGYSFEPPQRGGSNVYPQSLF